MSYTELGTESGKESGTKPHTMSDKESYTRKTFTIALLAPLCFYLAWSLCQLLNIAWPSVLNVAGHGFLAGSLPWSLPVVTNLFTVEAWLMQLLNILFISMGFAINITMLVFMVKKISKEHKNKKLAATKISNN
jgi:hypothetical protein